MFSLQKKSYFDFSIVLGFGVVLAFFVFSAIVSYWNTFTIRKNEEMVTQTHQVILDLEKLMSLAKDAETGQRGFVITGNERYLEPFNNALSTIDQQILKVKREVADNPVQLNNLEVLQTHFNAKLDELKETIFLRRNKGFDAAYEVVITDRGKKDMEMIRQIVGSIVEEETHIREKRIEEINSAYNLAFVSNLFCAVLGMILTVGVAYVLLGNIATRRRQQWIQSRQVGLSKEITGESSPEHLGRNILTFLAEYLGAHAGVFYTMERDGFRRTATYGLPDKASAPMKLSMGEGLLGQAIASRKHAIVRNVPEGYLQIGSALGRGNPRNLLVAVGIVDGVVNCVFELGFFHELDELASELIALVSESVAIAVRSANYRVHLQNLLEETQTQAEELQSQSEELRVANEELEEQSRALKSSQSNLEQQQIELEQSNAQLEEQTQLLEQERDNMARAGKTLQQKTWELEQANRYKSDFLANMSHELRTPLNSSLILAKLLADNPKGNLDDEQVKYAQNIQSSGNDLLNLINDILDLSKIEAGHMEILPEPVSMRRLLEDMLRTFSPLARDRGLEFNAQLAPGCPDTIETDRMRLEQVLKNLLANAMKFTEHGSVKLQVKKLDEQVVMFTVTDTGIGISKENYQAIFEAFRQADGTISRKYGGTGLGLSICRELIRLLGGKISVESESGKGSTFTVMIPIVFNADMASAVAETQPLISAPMDFSPASASLPMAAKPAVKHLPDDRDSLNASDRTIPGGGR